MFRRRIFYDITNSRILRSYMIEGDLKRFYTAEQEATDCGLTNWNVMEWDTPDEAIEAAFADTDTEGNPRTVTVTIVDNQLHFEYESIPIEDDPYTIIDTLTGEA